MAVLRAGPHVNCFRFSSYYAQLLNVAAHATRLRWFRRLRVSLHLLHPICDQHAGVYIYIFIHLFIDIDIDIDIKT